MMEQSRQARRFFDLAWFGIGAAGAVDPMAGLGLAAAAAGVLALSKETSGRLRNNRLCLSKLCMQRTLRDMVEGEFYS
jgi:hypothetical protein